MIAFPSHPTGFVRHTNNRNRATVALSASAGEGPAAERAGGPDQELDQVTSHRLKCCPDPEGNDITSLNASVLVTSADLIVAFTR